MRQMFSEKQLLEMIKEALEHLTGELPTSDPGVAGALWVDDGVLKVSTGE